MYEVKNAHYWLSIRHQTGNTCEFYFKNLLVFPLELKSYVFAAWTCLFHLVSPEVLDILCFPDSYEIYLQIVITTQKILSFFSLVKSRQVIRVYVKPWLVFHFMLEEERGYTLKAIEKLISKQPYKIIVFAQLLGQLIASYLTIQYCWLYTKTMVTMVFKANNDNLSYMYLFFLFFFSITKDMLLDLKWRYFLLLLMEIK